MGEEAVLCQWCNKWEHRACADINTDEYDVLTNSSKKIMFFCSLCHPKVLLALKLEDKNSSQSSDYKNLRKAVDDLSTKSSSQSSVYENLRKAVDDLSIKIDQLNSSEKILQQRVMDTTTALSSNNQSLNVFHSLSSVATNIVKDLQTGNVAKPT